MLRQANSYLHEDVIQPRLRPVVVSSKGVFEAWVRLDPGHPSAAVAVQVGGKKLYWGHEPVGDSPYGGGVTGTRKGPLPKPGEVPVSGQ